MSERTPWGYVWDENGGYDCMTDAFGIGPLLDGQVNRIAVIDEADLYHEAAEIEARYIVKAVNSHEALVSALREMLDEFKTSDYGHSRREVLAHARAALIKAEAE